MTGNLWKVMSMACHPLNRLKARWSSIPVRYRGSLVASISTICLAVTLLTWGWSRTIGFSLRYRIEHTDEVTRQSRTLLIDLINAETGVRGYAITRDPMFLKPYEVSSTQYQAALDTLRDTLKRDAQQLDDLQQLQNDVQRSMAISQQVIDTVNSAPRGSVQLERLTTLLTDGRSAMDGARNSVGIIQKDEWLIKADLLKQREHLQEVTQTAMWGCASVSILGLGCAIYLFSQLDRELRDRSQKLDESKSLLQAIVSNVVDGVINLDEHGRIEVFNPTAREMFGYAPSEVMGRRLEMLLKDIDEPHSAADDQKWEMPSAYPQQRGRAWQTLGLRKDGTTFPVAISISDVQLGDRRLLAIIRDMTEFQQTQAKLQARADELIHLTTMLAQTNNTLEDRNKELEQFAYVASHDLKAPLRAIANLSEWLEEDLQGHLMEENQHQMRLLRGRVLRMEGLINGLLEYSRVGRSQAPVESVSVKALLAEILDSLDPPATFTIDIAPNMPIFSTKVLLLQQVFTNLIGNAIKHHDRPDGTIRIRVTDQGNAYRFTVADDGPGIAANYHDKIFLIFQTLEARDTKESTGIGLSIVKRIIEAEGGTITVESEEGHGAAFHFTWAK